MERFEMMSQQDERLLEYAHALRVYCQSLGIGRDVNLSLESVSTLCDNLLWCIDGIKSNSMNTTMNRAEARLYNLVEYMTGKDYDLDKVNLILRSIMNNLQDDVRELIYRYN